MRLLRTWAHQIEYTEILDFYRNGIIINNLASGSFYNAYSIPGAFNYTQSFIILFPVENAFGFPTWEHPAVSECGMRPRQRVRGVSCTLTT